jgi:hypothetical protein
MEGWGMINNTANMYFNSVQQGFQDEMKALKNSDKFQRASSEGRKRQIKELEGSQRAAKQRAWKEQQALTMANITMNTADAIINALTQKPPSAGFALAALAGVMGAAQLSIVSGQKMPAFARGGDFITDGPQMIMVGDNPGGRERVQVTPLSSPNIDGPQGNVNNITVNVSAPLVDETVVDTIIPSINEAVLRGETLVSTFSKMG